MSPLFDIPGLTVLHELLHWYAETTALVGYEIIDYGAYLADGSRWFLDDGEGPESGFGAWSCAKLNARKDVDCKVNADGYAWLAMEAWLRWKCEGREVGEPVR